MKDPEWIRANALAAKYGLKTEYVYRLRKVDPDVKNICRKLPGERGPILIHHAKYD
jgi:hypothetical protein